MVASFGTFFPLNFPPICLCVLLPCCIWKAQTGTLKEIGQKDTATMEWYQLHQISSRGEKIYHRLFFFSGEAMGWDIGWLFTPLSARAILWMHLYLPSRRIRLTSSTEKKRQAWAQKKHFQASTRSIFTLLLHPPTAEVWISKNHSCPWVKSQPPHVLKLLQQQ